jgi:transposase
MDLGDRNSRYCVLSEDGEILREGQVATTKAGMTETFGALGRARIAIEVGTHSPWVSRLLQQLGHEVVVANPKQVKADHGEQPERRSIGRSNLGTTGSN